MGGFTQRGGVAKGFTSLTPMVDELLESKVKEIFTELIRIDMQDKRDNYNAAKNALEGNIQTNRIYDGDTPVAIPLPANTVVNETAYGQAAIVGTDLLYARQGHSHGTPGLSDVIPLQDRIGLGLPGTGLKPAREGHRHPEILHELRLFQVNYDTYPVLNEGIGLVTGDGKWSFLGTGLASNPTYGTAVSFRATELWTAVAQGSAVDITATPIGSVVGEIVATFTPIGLTVPGTITGSNLSGTNTGDQDLSGLVPYTGATGNVDIGTYNLTMGSGIAMWNIADTFQLLIGANVSANRLIFFPDASGTLALTSDLSAYQPLDSGLTDISGLAVTDGNFIVGDGANWVSESGNTARTSLGLGTGDSPTFTNLITTGYISSKNFTDSSHYTGFPNRTDTSLSWDDVSYTLTLTAVNKKIWIDGVEYNINTLTSQVTEITTGLYWFWITAPGGVPQLNNSTTPLDIGGGGANAGFDQCLVASVYWNTTTNKGIASEERHDFGRDKWMHESHHEAIRTLWFKGGTLSPTDTTFALTECEIYDEELEGILSATTKCRVLYKNGSADFEWDDNNATLYKLNGASMRYNNGNTLTNVSNINHVAMWVFATNNLTYPFASFIGQRQDVTLANARANNTPSSLSTGALDDAEMTLLYRVIFKQGVGSVTYIETADYRGSSNLPIGNYIATDHSTLSNLGFNVSGHTWDGNQDFGANDLVTTGTLGAGAATFTSLALGVGSITMSGSIGVTGTRVTKGWFANVESTGMYTVGGTSLSSTFAGIGQTMYIGTTGVAINRGSAALTLAGLTLTTPDIGTPSAGVLTNCTGYVGDSSLVTVGTIATGVWSGTAIVIGKGGTGATTASGARTNLGLTIAYGGAYRTANYAFGAVNTWYDLELNAGTMPLVNVSHTVGTTPDRVTVLVSGTYEITYSVTWLRTASGHHCVQRLHLNDTSEVAGSFMEGSQVSTDANETQTYTRTCIVTLAANDFVNIEVGTNLVATSIDRYDDGNIPDPTTGIVASLTVNRIG